MSRSVIGRQKGFTLIELLVVISIIGVLSTIAMTSLNGARTKARVAVVNTQMNNFIKAVTIAEGTQSKELRYITGSACSRCSCGGDLRNISSSSACYAAWANALNKIEAATEGTISGLNSIVRDPWGSPYLLDENEGEFACPAHDIIWSAGPDGVLSTSDDVMFTLPFAQCAG